MRQRRVTFRVRRDRGVSSVDLRGEMHHWSCGPSMRNAGDGWFESDLRLEPGVYEYKFRLDDGEWRLDPTNPRTRARDGVRNSVIVVDGTDEPLLHAPTRPYVVGDDDGRLWVRAALRRGAADPARVSVEWDEGAGPRRTPMVVAGEEDEHLLLEAELPGAGRTLGYLFRLDHGRLVGAPGGAGQAFELNVADVRPRAPAWWREAVVYSVFVDRFRRGGRGGRWSAPTVIDRDTRAGGDLDGIVEALPYLQELGITALHLTPICQSPSVHRYDAADPREIAPELGGEAALARLLRAADDRGIKILLDIAITHVHRSFFAFRDVCERGPVSPYWGWFDVYRYPFVDGQRPGYAHYQKGQWQEPLLRTDVPEVQEYLVGTFEHFAKMGAGGFRIDAVADVPVALIQRIARAVRAIDADAVLLGEVIPSHTHRWTASALDAATDFEAQRATLDWLTGRCDASRVSEVGARRRFSRGGPGHTALGFASTHDQARVRTVTGDARAARLALLRTLTAGPTPMIYYGDEVGLAADGPVREFEDSWSDRQCMPWQAASWDPATLALCRDAIALRRHCAPLREGDERFLDVGDDTVLALRRWRGDHIVDVLLHRGDGVATLRLDGDSPARALLTLGDAGVGNDGRVTLGAWSGVVLDRRAAFDERDDEDDGRLLARTREIATAAYDAGMVELPVLPASLYVTLTEACNLRCRHCITRAPELTRSRRARTVQPWLIDALSDAFAAADYVGFSHGGESLTAPILFDVLSAVQRAHAGRPGGCDVHLLTNGALLDDTTLRRLLGHGVTSLMVSLDGADAAVNDAIRVGGRFDEIVANVRNAVRVREAANADLRIGISTVVGRSNLRAVAAVARLAVDLGVDWLKLEETYPATPFARHDWLDPRADAVRAASAAAAAVLEPAGIVLVDHLAPPTGCACDPAADPRVRSFRAADDFANRTHFAPCRAAWHQACVDPDGTVRPVDYAHPPLGNLLHESLFGLWNSATAASVRARALANPTCQRRGPIVDATGVRPQARPGPAP